MSNKSNYIEGLGIPWKIIYARFEGVLRRAVELISSELGERVIREREVYKLHVMPCEAECEETVLDSNCVIIGTYGESALIQRLIGEEIKEGYAVRVMYNPECEGASIVVITAAEDELLYRAAAVFIDDYTIDHAPKSGSLHLRQEIFKSQLKPAFIHKIPKTKTRSIFAWGHPINDYRGFIRDMARVGLNQVILWNDFAPLNARDIVEYAHSFGIEVIWGFSWGWSSGSCKKIGSLDEENMNRLKNEVIKQYDEVWRGLGDGIYFQSFTELKDDNIGGINIAKVVTKLVNEVAEELYKRDPELLIQFGLHATSVKDKLEYIAKVDPRIEILWEDCGAFPYGYMPKTESEEYYRETLEFTERILKLRPGAPVGLVFKGFAILDWSQNRFVHQSGRFILGEASEKLSAHDRELRRDSWRVYTAEWIKHGEAARVMAERIYELTCGDVNLCMAGLFDGDLWIPEAICSEIFEDPTVPYPDTVEKVIKRRSTKID